MMKHIILPVMRYKLTLTVVLLLMAISQIRGQKADSREIVNEEIKTDHLTLALAQSQATAHPGTTVTLIADITLPPKMHIYAPGVKGYMKTEFNLDPNAAVTIRAAQFPKSQVMLLPAIRERVPVFEGHVRISNVTIVNPARVSQVDLSGTFDYQACDDQICYVPKKVPVHFTIVID